MDIQAPKRPETGSPDENGHCTSLGPFARFVQILDIYSQINALNSAHRRRDAEVKASDLERIDGLIETYLRSFPSDWQNRAGNGGEHLLDVTTIALAHWYTATPFFFPTSLAVNQKKISY